MMFEGKTILCLIPARAGSKGIPGKNIKLLGGKPLISHTIEAAEESGIIDTIEVSTDGKDIAHAARKAGANVPFIRPHELATDAARGIDVIHHALNWFENKGQKYDWVIVLQPTSPLRSAEDIKQACSLLLERKGQAVISVSEMEHHPWWSNTLDKDAGMKDFLRSEIAAVNRQQLPTYYRINGAIYLAEWDFIKNNDSWYGPSTYAYKMPRERSVDIDSELDFKLAEILLQ